MVSELSSFEIRNVYSDLALDILFRMKIYFPRGQHRQIYSSYQVFIVLKANSGWTLLFKSKKLKGKSFRVVS